MEVFDTLVNADRFRERLNELAGSINLSRVNREMGKSFPESWQATDRGAPK
ncbi:MAG: hypothetical protein OXB95_13800 [Rhodobacteraceae bacterium]|nr:hypothetical protein [Paracoccaceae bacterium]